MSNNYELNMMQAINNQSGTITNLQVSQAQSTDIMAGILNNLYNQVQSTLEGDMNVMNALNAFYDVMSQSNLGDYFASLYSGTPPSGYNATEEGGMQWLQDFNNGYCTNKSGSVALINTVAASNNGKSTSDWTHTSNWELNLQLGGQSVYITGSQITQGSNLQDYESIAQSQYSNDQEEGQNEIQADQTVLQNQQSGVQSTAQAGSNILSTGTTDIQAMSYTSNLLASPM
ncbi:MAG: hypothetical protein KDK56_09955 [Simkania sp.]|nr:hypothetical protein [Simkania sp.]MCB1075043.1 hypothetical protein [Simkania sp.]MCP5491004.1 hypothetical protein [Chlamydiales bacterium]